MEGGAACNGDVAFLDPSSTSLFNQSLTVWYQVWCHEAEGSSWHVTEEIGRRLAERRGHY